MRPSSLSHSVYLGRLISALLYLDMVSAVYHNTSYFITKRGEQLEGHPDCDGRYYGLRVDMYQALINPDKTEELIPASSKGPDGVTVTRCLGSKSTDKFLMEFFKDEPKWDCGVPTAAVTCGVKWRKKMKQRGDISEISDDTGLGDMRRGPREIDQDDGEGLNIKCSGADIPEDKKNVAPRANEPSCKPPEPAPTPTPTPTETSKTPDPPPEAPTSSKPQPPPPPSPSSTTPPPPLFTLISESVPATLETPESTSSETIDTTPPQPSTPSTTQSTASVETSSNTCGCGHENQRPPVGNLPATSWGPVTSMR